MIRLRRKRDRKPQAFPAWREPDTRTPDTVHYVEAHIEELRLITEELKAAVKDAQKELRRKKES